MYEYKELEDGLFVLSIANHCLIAEELKAFCLQEGILAGRVGGIGAISEATFRFLNPETKKYVDKVFQEQMEITNLTGNISELEGKPYLHLHLTCSRSDYSCIGGHLLEARINGACELFVEDLGRSAKVGRRPDPQTGLNIYDFGA